MVPSLLSPIDFDFLTAHVNTLILVNCKQYTLAFVGNSIIYICTDSTEALSYKLILLSLNEDDTPRVIRTC